MSPHSSLPPPRRWSWRAKVGDVLGNLLLALLGVGLIAGAYLVGRDVVMLRVLIAYTAFGVLITVALAVSIALTRRLPGLRRDRLDGEPALVVRSWPGDWWHTISLDTGLVLLAGTVVGWAGTRGTELLLLTLPVIAAGTWLLGRVILTAAGRRHREAVWLSATEIVHDAAWGRERVSREAVTRVRASTAPGADTLVIEVDGPIDRQLVPAPWRSRRAGSPDGRMLVGCALMGHAASDLAPWLADELGIGPTVGRGRHTGRR
ncbi:hypothetical protein [Nocardioides ferulae]|uniref:hypothetical protein n=1 Tax=Nocardioides ferulae TaxID=2340821 RepID=UPI000F877AD9|nr:hypothetical protein [Nocardioides ferulae]